jgi:signal transduction histidine kinase
MTRPWHIWTIFAICSAVLLAAVAGLTITVLQLEAAQSAARREADIEQDVRLALWRMESALAPLIARESSRPYFTYTAFFPAERAYTHMFDNIDFGDLLVPSPLLNFDGPYIRLHFQFDAQNGFTSPQVPTGHMRDLAESGGVPAEQIERARRQLNVVKQQSDWTALAKTLPLEAVQAPPPVVAAPTPGREPQAAPPAQSPGPAQQIAQQQAELNVRETQARARMQVGNVLNQQKGGGAGLTRQVIEGTTKALWHTNLLLLARRVSVNGEEYIQAACLDWSAIHAWLTDEIRDVFPSATLEPVRTPRRDDTRALAGLPVRLVPGPPASGSFTPHASPIPLVLTVVWTSVLLAAAAVVALLFGLVSLSERRAAFVSAVTHELRTPLTTFRLYTDLLAGGMITDPEKRRQYLKTLNAEASRLAHLVENVLAYARLERGRAGARVEDLPIADLLEKVQDRLADRAAQAGMSLLIEPPEDATAAPRVAAAPASFEQILFNLVDNACKYASGADDKRIHIATRSEARRICVRVWDHGQGIAAEEATRLFRPFHKSAGEAAHSAPGVGLGLSLSQRLARAMGGDLYLVPTDDHSACFELSLERVND